LLESTGKSKRRAAGQTNGVTRKTVTNGGRGATRWRYGKRLMVSDKTKNRCMGGRLPKWNAVNGKGGIHLCHEPTGRRSRKSGGIGKQSQVGFGAETRRGKATGMMRGRGGSRGEEGLSERLGKGGIGGPTNFPWAWREQQDTCEQHHAAQGRPRGQQGA